MPNIINETNRSFLAFIPLIFAWAIFPVFIHIPAGLRRLEFGRKIDRAASMLWSTNG